MTRLIIGLSIVSALLYFIYSAGQKNEQLKQEIKQQEQQQEIKKEIKHVQEFQRRIEVRNDNNVVADIDRARWVQWLWKERNYN